jgi:ArsR family transcriptional regulator
VADKNYFQDRCDCDVIHSEIVKKVKKTMPKDETLFEVGEFFKVFGDSTRVKIICALLTSEMCVCDIAFLLRMTKSSISHQLRILRQAKIVKPRKDGKIVYYSLDDNHVRDIFNQGFDHVGEKR